MAEYSTGKTCCTSAFDSKANCPGSFEASSSWSGYFVCGGSPAKTTHSHNHCGHESTGVCMGYNLKCFSSTLANCKATCGKTKGCKMAEYAAGSKTCCTSKYDSKKNCPGSFTKSASWKGYFVCGPVRTTRPVRTRPHRTTKKATGCNAESDSVCMGYNIKCFKTTLANCKATCKKTNGCKMAEYSTGKMCCTSKYSSKRDCPGTFKNDKAWKGYYICHDSSPINYKAAYQAFAWVDTTHSGSISYSAAYQALAHLFPKANEKQLDSLTKNGDIAHYDNHAHKYVFKDGKIDRQEFITIYLNELKNQKMAKAGCGRHRSCELCLARSQSKTFGQLCAWQSSGAGLCKQNIPSASFTFGNPLITSAAQCHGDVVHVHG